MSVRKIDKNNYCVDYSYGYSQSTQHRVRKKGFESLKVAKEYENSLKCKYGDTNKLNTRKFIHYLSEYLEYKQSNVKKYTYNNIQVLFNTYIVDYLEDVILIDINFIILKELRKSISDNNKLSNSSKNNILSVLNCFLKWCINNNYINNNPMMKIDKFKVISKDMNFYTLDEFIALIKIIDNIEIKTYLILLFFTGMRKGEALALRVNDMNSNKLTVNKTKSFKNTITEPKTKASNRTIILDKNTINQLDIYIQLNNLKLDDYIFNHSDLFYRQAFYKYSQLAGLKQIRLHDLRHSHVALLIELKEDIYVIKERLGHEKITTTLDTYGHLYKDKQKQLAEKLEALY